MASKRRMGPQDSETSAALLDAVEHVLREEGYAAASSRRVAEVAARFTLDAMPGKQMAIDADLNAGIIDENQARERRKAIGQEADAERIAERGAKRISVVDPDSGKTTHVLGGGAAPAGATQVQAAFA